MAFIDSMNELAKACRLLNEIFTPAKTNLDPLSKTLETAVTGDGVPAKVAAIRSLRPGISNTLAPSAVQVYLAPFVRDVVAAIGEHDRGLADNLISIRDYMQANAQSVLTRGITFGAIVAPKASKLLLAEVDRHGNTLDNVIPESWTFRCTGNQGTGEAEWQSRWDLEAGVTGIDFIDTAGSGETPNIWTMIDEFHANNLLTNASFTNFNDPDPAAGLPVAPSAVDSWPRWVVSDVLSFQASVDQLHRVHGGVSEKAITVIADGSIKQTLTGVNAPRRIPFREDAAYLPVGWLYLPAARTGTLSVSLGASSYTVDLSTLAVGWNLIAPNMATDIQNFYFPNFDVTTDLEISFAFTALSGSVTMDDTALIEMPVVNGVPFALIGGNTKHEIDDVFTTSFTLTAETVVQYWTVVRSNAFALTGIPFFFPHSATPTVVDVQ